MKKACENCDWYYITPCSMDCPCLGGNVPKPCPDFRAVKHFTAITSALVTEDYLVGLYSVTDFGKNYMPMCAKDDQDAECQHLDFICAACPETFRVWLDSPLTENEILMLDEERCLTELRRDALGKLIEG